MIKTPNTNFGGSNIAPADHNYSVYVHTSPNGKKYVGVTKQIPELRWDYGYGYHGNVYFYRAIKKYGWNNFSHEIVDFNLTQYEALLMEVDLIKKYDSFKHGYNLSYGGEGLPGRPLPERAISNSTKTNSKKVVQFTIDGKYIATFKSSAAASREMSASSSSAVNACARGVIPYAYGYLWAYEGNDPMIPDHLPDDYLFGEEESFGKPIPILPMCKRKNGQLGNKRKSTKVTQYDLNKNKIADWDSMAEAARYVGCDEYLISKCVRGKQHTASGFYWAKQGEEIRSPIPRNYSKNRIIYQIDMYTKKIIKEFKCLQDAEDETGVAKDCISNVCCKRAVSAGDFYWRYKDSPYEFQERYQANRTKVRCITTGEIFDSMTIAAKHFGFAHSNIEVCCQKKRKSTHGLEFEYVVSEEKEDEMCV